MRLWVIFKREVRDNVFSKRLLIYFVLLFLPVVFGAWLSYVLHEDPTPLIQMSAMFPEPITEMTPAFSMLFFAHTSILSVTLFAIIHTSDFIAGEQSRGTLLLLSSKPLHRWEIILGKYLAFLVVFVPLLGLSAGSMSFSISAIGIGQVPTRIVLAGFVSLLALGLVYASISTLFSSMTKRKLTATLAAFIFMVVWFTLDTIIIYVPEKIADVLVMFSLSDYTGKILGYISGEEKMLSFVHRLITEVSFTDFLWSSIAIIVLTVIPVMVSMIILEKRDIHGR